MGKSHIMKNIGGASLVTGTLIGAGILGLPSGAMSLGLLPSLAVLTIIGIITYYSSLPLLKGAEKYDGAPVSQVAKNVLGRPGGYLMMGGIMFYIYGALLAYITAGGRTISTLLPIGQLPAALIFWAVTSYIIYKGLELTVKSQIVLVSLFVVLILVLSIASLPVTELHPDEALFINWGGIGTFIGVTIFAFAGHAVWSDVFQQHGSYKESKKSMLYGFLLSFILYAVFMSVFTIVFGKDVPAVAPRGFDELYGEIGMILGNILPLATVATSHLGFGLAQRDNWLDYANTGKIPAWGLTVLPPLILYLLGYTGFVGALSMAGNVGGLIQAFIIPVAIYLAWKWKGEKINYETIF